MGSILGAYMRTYVVALCKQIQQVNFPSFSSSDGYISSPVGMQLLAAQRVHRIYSNSTHPYTPKN